MSLLNLIIILIIAYLVSYKPDLITKIIYGMGIIAFAFGIMTYIYKIILIIFFYERVNQESLINVKDLFSVVLVWLITGILIIISLKVYNFY